MQKKFYRPGKLEKKGTKISLKTQPYVNGVLFNLEDPISSFHSNLSSLAVLINQYEYLSEIPGIKIIQGIEWIEKDQLNRLKILLQYLVLSPIEITLKEQIVDSTLMETIQVAEEYERQR